MLGPVRSDYPRRLCLPVSARTRQTQIVTGSDTNPSPRATPSPAPARWPTEGGVLVERAPVTDPICDELLRRYVGELERRFGRDFDVSRASPLGEHDFDPPCGVFVVGRLGGRPVACGGMRTLEPGVGEIRRMYVDPSARGRGVGGAVLAALEDAARQMGHAIMRLDTASELHEAHRLYEGAGYVAVPAYNDNEFAARWYEKRLR